MPYSWNVRRIAGVALLFTALGTAADDDLRQAAAALEANDFATAIPHLEAALEDEPGNVNARFNLAFACQSTGDEAAAIRHYRWIAGQQPELIPARQNLATLLMRAGEYGEAAREYAAVAADRPDDLQVQLLLADAHLRAGSAEASVAAYERALDASGSSMDALLGIAGALVEAGRLIEAVPYYLRAAKTDPEVENLLLGIADRLERAGSGSDALELYRRYARNRPDDAAVQEDLGVRLLEAGNVHAAKAALERSVATEPSASRHAALAEAYRRDGDSSAAREQLRLAALAQPGNAAFRVRYATALLHEKDYERAAQEYLVAGEADPLNRDAWNGLALAAFQLDNFPIALRALEASERTGPLPAASVYLRALAMDRLQMYEEARAAYRAFLDLTPEMPDEVWKAQQRLLTIDKVLAKR